MIFDVFHSIGRIDGLKHQRSDEMIFADFFSEVEVAESCGYGTIWCAESHFSSQLQQNRPDGVIPNYCGEIGLNCDSPLLAMAIFEKTQRLGFGTAIFNIVGGNGGPIAAADRIRTLIWHNSLRQIPRSLSIGIAAGRFPYINEPFGIVPRDPIESLLWPQYKRLIFLEALEIFLRLSYGETIGSEDLTKYSIDQQMFRDLDEWQLVQAGLADLVTSTATSKIETSLKYRPRWHFESLQLIPAMPDKDLGEAVSFVLGSSDPMARELALRYGDIDLFNLSFTAPEKIEAIHTEMIDYYGRAGRTWSRSQLPRTVLVFIDHDYQTAAARASDSFDVYIEAMRGTVGVPEKTTLQERALIGTPDDIRRQLALGSSHGFAPEDRLMLWFEFSQTDSAAIKKQMQTFADQVIPYLS